jgi:putative restriction endonuclease
LSGGYDDDLDEGDVIIYTGAAGNDPGKNQQIQNEDWQNRGNAGLLKSMDERLPVRVIRGGTSLSFLQRQGITMGAYIVL